MSGYKNFDRQYRLAIGPAGGTGFEIGATTSEQPIPLHINFAIEKADLESQNTGKIEVWNLSPAHLAMLEDEKCCLSLRAGYGNRLPLIFAGTVSYSSTCEDGADRKTEIEVNDSLIEMRNTYVSLSYNGTVNWKTILDDVATQMGVVITYSYNATFVDVANGFSFVGLAKDVIHKGCQCCGLTWSIQNGIVQVKKPGDVMSREVFLISAKTGMIGIPVRVVISEDENTKQKTLGWDVQYLLNGAIGVDDFVKLESNIVTGYFRVYSVETAGDNLSGDWMCKARLLEVKPS